MTMIDGVPSCEKPGCHEEPEKTYSGKQGNKLRLCGKHYYKLVTCGESETNPLGLGTDGITQSTAGANATLTMEEQRERALEPDMNIKE